MSAVAGNASVCQGYQVSRITGERRAELKNKTKNWGPGARKRGERGGWVGGN